MSIETTLNENKAKQAEETVVQLREEIAADAAELEKVRTLIKALSGNLADIDRRKATSGSVRKSTAR